MAISVRIPHPINDVRTLGTITYEHPRVVVRLFNGSGGLIQEQRINRNKVPTRFAVWINLNSEHISQPGLAFIYDGIDLLWSGTVPPEWITEGLTMQTVIEVVARG